MFGVSLDEGLDECRFADSGRTDNSDDDGRGLFRQAVDEGNMESFFFDVVGADSLFGQSTWMGIAKGLWIAVSCMFFLLFCLTMRSVCLVFHFSDCRLKGFDCFSLLSAATCHTSSKQLSQEYRVPCTKHLYGIRKTEYGIRNTEYTD